MTYKQMMYLKNYLRTSRLLIIILLCAQILTTTYIVNDIMQERENQLNAIICHEEQIPLSRPPFEIIEELN